MKILEDLRFDELPLKWNQFNLSSFSKKKVLYNYQIKALKRLVKTLFIYYEDLDDFKEKEKLRINLNRKKELFKRYQKNGLNEDIDIKIASTNRRLFKLLEKNYSLEENKIEYYNFINRISFWMATGSGKSLIIIKLIEILKDLIDRKEIPDYDVLFLTYRDDLIEQFKNLVEEFNNSENAIKIIFKDLREYPEIKKFGISSTEQEFLVYYYRSDNLSYQQKQKVIDFRNYNNRGKWFLILDEAHKGDKEESIRQQIYSIFCKNGFLFNFSATFTDIRDKITCAFEFNLGSFIKSGYGKHIYLLKQEIRAFKKEEDFNLQEKQKIVIKSLVLLTYIKEFSNKIHDINHHLYHKPLILTLVHTVNVKDADLILFFRELSKLSRGKFKKGIIEDSKKELINELKKEPHLFFEQNKEFYFDEDIFKKINFKSILSCVFNSKTSGEIEVLRRLSTTKEIAFKLKTSEEPFALIKIGDIMSWLRSELKDYNIQESFQSESYFKVLNNRKSSINLLMGSQSFYEGWDSNRPNIINFINIGKSRTSKKYILQSIGRGVRIEPLKDERKRLINLYNSKIIPNKNIDQSIIDRIQDLVKPLETLLIFATDRESIRSIIEDLNIQKSRIERSHLPILRKNNTIDKIKLYIPNFKESEHLLIEEKEIKFEINKKELNLVRKYFDYIQDDIIILLEFSTQPRNIKLIRDFIKEDKNFKFVEKEVYSTELLIQKLLDFSNLKFKGVDEIKLLNNEISHYKNMELYLENSSNLKKLSSRITNVVNYPKELKNLMSKFKQNLISLDEYNKKFKSLNEKESLLIESQKISIIYFNNHFYNPIILEKPEEDSLINYSVNIKSEINFIEDLEEYVNLTNNSFEKFDYWFFSKLNEHCDNIHIPYYDENINKIREFYPDFIFWFIKNNKMTILFIDPKGTEHMNWIDKLNGYKFLFEKDGKVKQFNKNNLTVEIRLLFRTEDITRIQSRFPNYSKYWFEEIEDIYDCLK